MLVPLALRILEPEGTLAIRKATPFVLQIGRLRPREGGRERTGLRSEPGLEPKIPDSVLNDFEDGS